MDNFNKFVRIQIERIEKDKWIEEQKICHDPGDEFVLDWIYHNAKLFRDQWNNSCCKVCCKCDECGFNVLSACDGLIIGD